jgi:holliday junction DNA helicase RuvB
MTKQPTSGLDSLIGMRDTIKVAKRDIKACLVTSEQFPHAGIFGNSGLGKSSFASAIAYELKYYFEMIEGAMTKTRNALQQKLIDASNSAKTYEKRLLFFVDEVHRLPQEPQEALYYPMVTGQVTGSNIQLQPFSIFVATTHPHLLSGPFMSRLQNKWYLDRYIKEDICKMIIKWLNDVNLGYEVGCVEIIANRSLGIPRTAYNLVRKIRNEVLSRGGIKKVSVSDCTNTFVLESIDPIGLTKDQVRYLQVLQKAGGTPKGVGGLAGSLDRDVLVVSDSIEPILLSLKFIDRTARGRVLTDKGYRHLVETSQI